MTKRNNPVALVTGGSRGIGRAISLELADNGFTVIINFIQDVPIRAEFDSILAGEKITRWMADVSIVREVEEMVTTIMDKFGRIDVLVNNAGIKIDHKLGDMPHDEWCRVLDVNLTGTFNCTKAVIPHMIKQGEGRIVNISSVAGLTGAIGTSNYSASKAGIIGFTKAAAREYAKKGIIINAVAPGIIKTDMTTNIRKKYSEELLEQIPANRFGSPEDVAKLVAFLASDSQYIVGQVIGINGGLYM